MQTNGLDEKDRLILDILITEGRMSYSDIGERVGLSRTAVKNRITEMENAGIIKGYRAVIDPQNTSDMMTFVVNIETTADSFEEAKRIFAEAEETVTLIQTTGNCHLVAICLSQDIKTMRTFVNRIYKTVRGIQSINAHTVLDIIKGSIIPEKILIGARADDERKDRRGTV